MNDRVAGVLKVAGIAAASVLVLLALFLGVSWVASAPREGTVEAAWLVPAHWERYQSGSICASYDQKGYCTFSIPVYSDRWVADSCHVRLNNVEKGREWTWGVACVDLPSYRVGQYVTLR